MFDKIFKICLLIILAFAAYTFYLYVINTRYYAISGPRSIIILDRKTGQTYLTSSNKTIESQDSELTTESQNHI